MTISELIERAMRQLNAGSPRPHIWTESEIDIAACVKQASAELALQVMFNTANRSLLQQTYSVSLNGAGVGFPLQATGSVTGLAGEILLQSIRYGTVISDGDVLQFIPHYADFIKPQPLVFAYYCLKDRSILTRKKGVVVNGPNDIVGVTGPLSVTANFQPARVEDVPSTLEDDLVNILCAVLTRKLSANAASG